MMEIGNIKKAYFIGIKGVGMTALAQVLQGMNVKVLGSDVGEKFFTDEVLNRLGIQVFKKFDSKNVPLDADAVVASVAYLSNNVSNPEIDECRRRNIPLLAYPQVLGTIFKNKYGVAIAGTHGKSTTTAMLGLALEEAGFDPTAIVGTRIIQWQSNARVGQSEYLVAEADEYRCAFDNYEPQGLILTNIEFDHPDCFRDFDEYCNAFRRLVQKIPANGFIIANRESKKVQELVKEARCKVVNYAPLRTINLQVPGRHNLSNAAAALAAARLLGVSAGSARKSLAAFKGVSRRLEKRKSKNGIVLIDDYAHHPTEIRASLAAIRDEYPKRKIWAVFQPHTFSRTEALLDDFGGSFGEADEVVVLDIYSSAREKKGNVHSKELVEKIKANQNSGAQYTPSIKKAAAYLKAKVKRGDVVLSMGAGDVWRALERF